MVATIEDLNIVIGALTSCKSIQEIATNVQLPISIVEECLTHLKKTGQVSQNDFTDEFCPIEKVTGEVCGCCNAICDAFKE
jgi:DNA-binding IclR family transcriptional regulator